MGKKAFFIHICITVFICVACLGLFSSCSSSRNNTKTTAAYSKKKTRYQPNWNHTTSQTTTYHIRKHSTRKRHNP